jgi:hypothetical protein
MNNLKHTLDMFWNESARSLPTILIGLLILVVGWIIAKIIAKIIFKLLSAAKGNKISSFLSLSRFSEKLETKIDLPLVVSKIAYWVVFLFFIVAASETFGWTNVSKEISGFIMYLPRVFSAILIFALGYTIASFVRDSLKSVSNTTGLALGGYLSEIIFYFLIIIVSITALTQAGVDTSILSAHAVIIVGAFAATFAIAAGLGSREVVGDLFKNFYNRRVIQAGDKVKLKDISGTIEEVTRTSIVIKHESGKTVVPANEFYENTYEILD